MECIDPNTSEVLEVLACDRCIDPQWTAPFPVHPDLKTHYCDKSGEWRWSYYGTDKTFSDAGETLANLMAHKKALIRESKTPILRLISEVLENGRSDS